jgi:hypothetical protein
VRNGSDGKIEQRLVKMIRALLEDIEFMIHSADGQGTRGLFRQQGRLFESDSSL